jgi:hypothetical protein
MNSDSDWNVLLSFLPSDWEALASRHGALTRLRGFDSAESLLRTLMIHLGQGCSLRETAVRAQRGGVAAVSDVAILKRLRRAEAWLHALCQRLCETTPAPSLLAQSRFRLVAVDATCISEPGSTGTDWKLHYALEMPSLTCVHFELTDCSGAEKLERFPIGHGDLVLADRAYCGIPGLRWALAQKANVLVRMKVSQGNFYLPGSAEPFDFLDAARDFKVGEMTEWSGFLGKPDALRVPGRLCLMRRPEEVAAMAREKAMREARKKGRQVRERTLRAADYVGLFCTLQGEILTAELFDLYRFRWQVELAFKRLKSITDFGHLPKRDPASCRAWLYGKLLVGLLVDKMAVSPFFP